MAEGFTTKRSGYEDPAKKRRWHSFDEPAPTVQAAGIGDERPRDLIFASDASPAIAPDPTKPPYRIPLMEEIRTVDPSGLTVMSTFSGCGGSCLGFEWAGYRPLLAVEFVAAAVASYEANHLGIPVYSGDIRELTVEAALELLGLAAGDLDVLEGSPPCESFSTSGVRSKGWGKVRDYSDGKKQVMDDLFYEFIRLVGGIRPRAFVAENVSGLVKGVSKGYYKRIHAALAAQGYRVEARLLDAQWLGVPQRRQRVIFIGIRDDVPVEPADCFPAPLPYRYSIRDAISGVDAVIGGWPLRRMSADDPAATVGKGGYTARGEHEVVRSSISDLSLRGGEAFEDGIERIVYENGGRGGAARDGRAEEDLDAPARTITNAHAASTHFKVTGRIGQEYERVAVDPDGPMATVIKDSAQTRFEVTETPPDGKSATRQFSIAELRRLCGFPDDFILKGTYTQQWERLGNSVPPPMMYHVAAALRDALLAA